MVLRFNTEHLEHRFRGCNLAEKGRSEVADPEKRMVGTSVKYSRWIRT